MSLLQHLPASRLRPRRREVLPTAAVTAAAAGAATVLATVDPNQAGHYPGARSCSCPVSTAPDAGRCVQSMT